MCANKWLMLNCYSYIVILESIYLSTKNELRLVLKCHKRTFKFIYNVVFCKTPIEGEELFLMTNNSSPSIGVLQKTNVIYKFKCPLGDCISDNNNNIYVGLTSTTLSRRLTMHLSDTSSIAQHLKKHSCPTTQLRKILTDNTTILEHQNNKQKL